MFYIYAVIVFFMPLVFGFNTKELYEFPKTTLLYIFTIIAVTAFSLFRVFKPRKIILPNTLVLLFFAVYVLSTIFSSHVYTSLWGYYGRFNGGLVSLIAFLVIYIISFNLFSRVEITKLIYLSLLSIVPIGLFGVFQHFSGIERVYSTFGQPNWLAQYMAMQILLVVWFYVKSKKYVNFWLILYSVGFACLWFTYSLSGLAGFLIGFALVVLLAKNFKRLSILAVFSLLIMCAQPGIFVPKIKDLIIDAKKLTLEHAVVYAEEESNIISDSGFIRSWIWRGTLSLIFSSPKTFFIGTGPQTFPYSFQKFRPAYLNYSSEWDFILNRPHNYYLEIWSELGVFGLISYLLVLAWVVKKSPAFLLPSLVAFGVSNFLGWPVVATNLLFWLWLSFLEASDA